MSGEEWADELCTCGHRRERHCLDDECCDFDWQDPGGYCFEGCGCACFERPDTGDDGGNTPEAIDAQVEWLEGVVNVKGKPE